MSDNLSSLVGPSGPVGFSLDLEQDNIHLNIDLKVFDELTVKKADQLRSGPSYYRMEAKVRGYCVIIDNAEFKNEILNRSGSRADADRLKKVFTQMGFDVKSESDLTASEMFDLCKEISEDEKLSEHDALVVIILSHGGDDGLICAKDYKEINERKYGYVTDKKLLHLFNDANCPLLKGKPKMFFFNFCRGKAKDKIQKDSVYNDQLLSDVFVGYGTRDGYVGHRHPIAGSHFTIALATKLIQLSYDKELKDIYEQIIEYVEKMSAELINGKRFVRQRPTSDLYKWHKELYFNTGLDKTNSDSTEPIANTSTPKESTNFNSGFDIKLVEGNKNQIGGVSEMYVAENVSNKEALEAMENIKCEMRAVKGDGNYLTGKVKMVGISFANPK